MSSISIPEAATVDTLQPVTSSADKIPTHVTKRLIGGTSALGVSVFIERGAGFLANLLAARLGGASTFGGYSLAISTANNISTYAAGGIGATAARFSGKYPRGSRGYSTFARALTIVSLVSAVIAAAGLWFGAAPIAHLLQKQSLTTLLRWAALSAAGIVLVECARGFFVGQRHLRALVLLSTLVGVGMISFIPLAAKMHSPIRMIVSQGSIAIGAILVCMLLARSLGLFTPGTAATGKLGPMLREVWSFGFVQLAGLIGLNLSGWWLTTLVARADTTLVQMSFFAIASQLRNIAALPPSLLTESGYAFMTDPEGEGSETPQHVMALCTFGATFASLMIASVGITVMPWVLRILYGHTYDAATVTTCIALAVAVVHMGNGPAAARLSIVSLRSVGVINTLWAILVAVGATVFLLHQGTAWKAMTIFLVGHMLSAIMVLCVLYRKDFLPRSMVTTFLLGTITSVLLAALAYLRAGQERSTSVLTVSMAVISVGALSSLYVIGKKHHWLPSTEATKRLTAQAFSRLRSLRRGSVGGAS
ncbi:oligosaccharide flippase family protein [Edaphobacter sp. HDX4]|uniref:lipopolysaccharide biosynthesis protein n=1 Tax=Edaphobacter sp. HDX4 TaxID=2794064 RepID=UPI002FE677A3